MPHRPRHVGGLGTLTSCIDGDCTAINILDAIADLVNEARGTAGAVSELSRVMEQRRGSGLQRLDPVLEPKKKRKVSKYQREFGKQLKALKRKHPRTPVTRLMKRAHRATRKKMRSK